MMMAPVLAALLFTSTFFLLMWTYDIITSYIYHYLRERELRAYEKIVAQTEALIARERAYHEEISKMIKQYDIMFYSIDSSKKQKNE